MYSYGMYAYGMYAHGMYAYGMYTYGDFWVNFFDNFFWQFFGGKELIVHHLQRRKSKPALISPSILFKDAIASKKDPKKAILFLKAISSCQFYLVKRH